MMRRLLLALLAGLLMLAPLTAAGFPRVAGAAPPRPRAASLAAGRPRRSAAPTTAAAAPEPIEYVGSAGAGVGLVVVSGTLGFVNEGSSLTILSLSDPSHPVRLSRFPTQAAFTGIRVVSNLAYITLAREFDRGRQQVGQLLILDISDPVHPALRGSYNLPAGAGLQVVGTRAYLTYNSTLQILDVSNPVAPIPLGSYSGASEPIRAFYVAGTRAYLAAGGSGLVILDIANPAAPTLLSTFTNVFITTDVQVIGDLAYLTDGAGALIIVDVTNGAAPVQRGKTTFFGDGNAVAVVNNRAYVPTGTGVLRIFDVSAPASITELGNRFIANSLVFSLQVAGGLAYLAAELDGLQILDVSDPANMALLGSYVPPATPVDLDVDGDRVYSVTTDRGIQVLDVSDPRDPRLLGGWTALGGANGVQVVGDRAYLVNNASGFQILDLTDPISPTVLGSFSLPLSAADLDVVGDLAYVADSTAGLYIVDISTPASPVVRGHYSHAQSVRRVQVAGNLAFVTDETGLQIVDVANPAAPIARGRADTPAYASTSQVVGNLAYMTYTSNGFSDKTNGFQITDVSDPLNPIVRAHYTLASDANGIEVVGTLAYLANTLDGLQVFDVRDPTAPRPLLGYDTVSAQAVHLVGDLAFIADYSGFQVLRVHPTLFPAAATVTTNGGTLVTNDGSVQVTFPAGAVATTTTITYTQLVTPSQPLGSGRRALRSFTLEARQAGGQPVTHFDRPYTLVISYTNGELAAVGATDAELTIAFWNGSVWVDTLPCAGCGVDRVNHRITVVLDHFSEFALVGSAAKRVLLPLLRR